MLLAAAGAAVYFLTKQKDEPGQTVAGIGAWVKNFHVLKVSYLGASNYEPSRIKITSERFKKSKTISYNHNFNSTAEGAIDYLESRGFDIVGKAEGKDCYYIISTTFEAPN